MPVTFLSIYMPRVKTTIIDHPHYQTKKKVFIPVNSILKKLAAKYEAAFFNCLKYIKNLTKGKNTYVIN